MNYYYTIYDEVQCIAQNSNFQGETCVCDEGFYYLENPYGKMSCIEKELLDVIYSKDLVNITS